MCVISEIMLMLFAKNYQNYPMLVENTACQSRRVFESETQCRCCCGGIK